MSVAVYNPVTNSYETQAGPDQDLVYTADGPISHGAGVHAIAKVSAAAMTLSQPTAAEENIRILLTARTAFAHKVAVAGGLGGNAADAVITFAKVGDGIELIASNLRWVPTGAGYGTVIAATLVAE